MATNIEDLGGRDPHVLLGVRRGATAHQIQRAFRQRMMSGGHPDRGGDNATFRALTQARDILLDPRRLNAYDATVRARATSQRPPAASTSTESPARSATKRTTMSSTVTPPTGTGGWGVATVILALLGPLAWPLAIVAGHIAVRRARRSGRDSGSVIPVILVLLYILSFLVLPRILMVMVAAIAG